MREAASVPSVYQDIHFDISSKYLLVLFWGYTKMASTRVCLEESQLWMMSYSGVQSRRL